MKNDENKKSRLRIMRFVMLGIAIALASYFMPHIDPFHYQYEMGHPWRYGLLKAPYDFAIYHSDSTIQHMEDSLWHQLTPRYLIDEEITSEQLEKMKKLRSRIPSEGYRLLSSRIDTLYNYGILYSDNKDSLVMSGHKKAYIRRGNQSVCVDARKILCEKEAYEFLQKQPHADLYAGIDLRSLITVSLTPDTAMLYREFARERQNISATSGMVQAETRIIDNGEIITPTTYNILESYKKEFMHRSTYSGNERYIMIGNICLIAILLSSIMLFLKFFRHWHYDVPVNMMVAIGMVTIMFILSCLISHVAVGAVYLVPIGIATVTICVFLGSRTAYFCHMTMVLLCSFAAPSQSEYLVIQSVAGIVIIFCMKDGLNERSQLMKTTMLLLITYVVLYTLLMLAEEGSIENISLPVLGMMSISALLLTSSYLVLYAIERSTGLKSGVTLLELCNISRGLLLELDSKCPGTFQHSHTLSKLAVDAALAIRADVPLVRAAAYYHDIGKLCEPGFYTENREHYVAKNGGVDKYANLTFEEKLRLVKRHVTYGIELARKANLPTDIIDFIETHHGHSEAKYFSNTWRNEHPDEEIDIEHFCHQGRDPETKEQVILMMADTLEAASRSLSEKTEESITGLVNRLIDEQRNDGRFRESKITFREIEECKRAFIASLLQIHHARIAYPEVANATRKTN